MSSTAPSADDTTSVNGDEAPSEADSLTRQEKDTEPAPELLPARLRFLSTRLYRWLAIIVLAGVAALAAWIGVLDGVIRPLSLASQTVGLSYVLAGIAAFVCALALVSRHTDHWWLRAMIIGGASGAYVALSVALAARLYKAALFWGLLAVGLLCLSFAVLGGVELATGRHVNLSAPIKALGASLAVIIAASQLWYTSIYQPNNSDVGFDISSTVGRPENVSPTLELVPVDVVVRNDSAFSAVLLTSLYMITGVGFDRAAPSRLSRDKASLREASAIGMEVANPPGFTSTYGSPKRALLAVGRVLIDGSYLRANGTTTLPIVVPVPANTFQEIIVQVDLSYARESRVTLEGQINRPLFEHPRNVKANCTRDVRRQWRLAESELDLLAHGRQVLDTNWCAPPEDGGIFSEVAQASDARRVHPINATRNNREYGISYTARRDMFMLPSIGAGQRRK